MKEPGFFGSLPEGVPAELTVTELEEMACRQQQQIESQRQLLAAKEQRLRFLKQHEAKHQLVATEHERLRRLRDKVESQEQKLRKLRALRGQVDQTKLNNVSLTSDLETIRALFNEKEKELSIAVAKVEELTRQLEELQRGRETNSQMAPSIAAVELEKLRAELMYRNKLNEQHSARLTHQRELLAQRQEEMAAIDRRIGELQERLHRKRLLNQQLAHHINKQQQQSPQENNQKCTQMYHHYQQQQQPQQQQQSPVTSSTMTAGSLPPQKTLLSPQQQQQLHQHQLQQQQQQKYLQQQQKLQQQMQYQKYQQMQQQQMAFTAPFNQPLQNKTVPQPKNNHSIAQGVGLMPKPMTTTAATTTTKTITSSNIAAVEPYHHVPSSKSAAVAQPLSAVDAKRGYRKNDVVVPPQQAYQHYQYHQQPAPPPPPLHAASSSSSNQSKEAKSTAPPPLQSSSSPAADDTRSGAKKDEERSPSEFWPNKFEARYQTMPSMSVARFSQTLSRYDTRKPAEGVEGGNGSSEAATNKKSSSNDATAENNEIGSDAVDGTSGGRAMSATVARAENAKNVAAVVASGQQQNGGSPMQPMSIVRSMPIQTSSTKCLATPLSNANHAAKSTPPAGVNNYARPYETPPYNGFNNNPANALENHTTTSATTCSPTVVTFTSTYQKPVSSVSPIYQTSSTRIQPVQPQIIGSLSIAQNQQQQIHAESHKPYSQQNDVTHSTPPTNNNHCSKPALPPKPAPPVKATPPPPPRQSAFHAQFVTSQQLAEKKCVESTTVAATAAATTTTTTGKLAHTEYSTINANHNSQPLSCETRDENGNRNELETRLAALEMKEKSLSKYAYSKDNKDANGDLLLDANGNNVSTAIVNGGVGLRNGIVFGKEMSPKMSDSPPPLPNVEPPSDDELDRSSNAAAAATTKLKTMFAQNTTTTTNDKNNNESKENNRLHQMSINDRLMGGDLSQDSSSSDTSTTATSNNNYFVSTNRRIELPPAYLFPENLTPPRDLIANADKDANDIVLNLSNGEQINVDTSSENEKSSSASLSPSSDETEKMNAYNESKNDEIKKVRKGNLKNTNSVNSKRRVSFDPLALLLDASLEGELELVVRTAGQVKNPSAANDEGITALHNAICAGHFEIVKFLVQFGCDVNAQDSDGWTPLHCAASCNNLPMVRFLVEHGACIFATTLSDQETAAEKCEEDEEGFDGCSEFLYSVQEKLGILNNGAVYAVFDYEAHNPDELSFKEGDQLTILRKGDEWEREWWWSRLNDKEGYIPRNLLGLFPRIHPNSNNKIPD